MVVNHESYPAEHTVVPSASCTTNSLALGTKVGNDKFGKVKGLTATMHAIYSDAVDRGRPQSRWHASENIIPSSMCAASTVGEVDPELNGRLTAMAF